MAKSTGATKQIGRRVLDSTTCGSVQKRLGCAVPLEARYTFIRLGLDKRVGDVADKLGSLDGVSGKPASPTKLFEL